jgi:hypothetical protein
MRSLPLFLCAMLLLARPQPARAEIPALALPGVVRAGESVEIRWSDLPASAEEVELELSLDGGRWVRISPELEARERHFLWRVPRMSSARARLRLRAGGRDAGRDFEDEVTVSAGFRIECPEPLTAGRARTPDWWQVGSRVGAPGWGRGAPEPKFSNECGSVMAVPDSRWQTIAPATASAFSRLDRRIAISAPCTANAGSAATRGQPLRL